MVRWMPATCSSRCSPAASCGWSVRRRWTSTASTSRRTRRSSDASSRCTSASRASRTPWRSCAASRSATRRTTRSRSATPRSWPPRTLSDRYISGRQLPDKAIDLVDEAASRLRMEIDSSPVEIDVLRARSTACGWRRWPSTGDRPGLGGPAGRRCARRWPTSRRSYRSQRPLGAGEGRASTGSAS